MPIFWPFNKKKIGRTDLSGANSFWRGRGDASLEGSEGIFAAVTRLSNILASVPMTIYRDGRPDKEHYLAKLLNHEVAPGMTPFMYKNMMEACRNAYGNAYALKVPGLDGRVARLDVLDPERVKPMRDEESGDIWYKLSPLKGPEIYVHYKEMIHVRHVSTNKLLGISPVDVLKDAVEYDKQMQSFSLQALKGINSCVTLNFPSNLGEAQKKQIIDDFMENYKASSGGLIVLSGGVQASVITKSPVDSKVLDVEKITKGRISSVYTIPPHMLGVFENASYGSNEQQMLELLQLTMRAIFQQYADEHELKLLSWEDKKHNYSIGFDEYRMIIPTRLERAQEMQYQIRNGQRSINELRRQDGFPPKEGGDELLTSRDLIPLSCLVDRPEQIKRYI